MAQRRLLELLAVGMFVRLRIELMGVHRGCKALVSSTSY